MSRLNILNREEINAFDKPSILSAEQRKKYFYLSDKTFPILNKLRTPTNKLCVLLQWGYFRASGRFFLVNDFHSPDIKYIAQLLEINLQDIDLPKYHKQRKTYREHQDMILNAMSFKPFDASAKFWLKTQLKHLITKHMQPREIIYYICSQCHQKRIEIPSYHFLCEHITQQYNKFEHDLSNLVELNITSIQKGYLQKLLDEKINPPLISKWKTHNDKLQVKSIQENITIFSEIKSYFYKLAPLLESLDLSENTYEYYATWVKKAKLSQLKQMPDKAKLYLNLSAFIRHQLYLRQDYLIDIFLKSVQTIRNKAKRNRLEHEQSQRKERNAMMKQLVDIQDRLETLVLEIVEIVNEDSLSDRKKINEIKALLKSHEEIKVKLENKEQIGCQSKIRQLLTDDTYYSLLEDLSLSLQRRVANIVKRSEFDSTTSDKLIINAINHFKEKDGLIDEKAPIDFLDKKEKMACFDEDNKIRKSLYKIFLFSRISDCIKSGSLNLKYSHRYKAIQDYLISKSKWDNEKLSLLETAGLSHFANIDNVLLDLKKSLNDQYKTINEKILSGKNDNVKFDNAGHYSLTTPKVEKKNTEAISEVLCEPGFIPIIQILRDVNEITKFTDRFKHYSVKNQKLKPSPEVIIAGIMAKGHNIGINKLSHISVGINGNTLRQTVNWFFTNKNIQSANNKIIGMINKLSLSGVYKYDPKLTHTSSDGQKYQISVDSLQANFSFKYFGKDKGVTAYTFIDDRQSLFYSTVISASEREAPYVMDGLLHNSVVKSDIHSTDMHGFTETIFAATHFIGTGFAPRFKNLAHKQIYAFSSKQSYIKKGFKILPSRTIDQKCLYEQWDDILRFMTTIKLKEASASVLFKRLSSYAKDHPLYKAIKEFGRIIKSIYVLTYIDDLKLRQQIEKQLNRVELSNKFSKAVYFEKSQEFNVATRDEQEVVANCKSLIQNGIVLWNYLFLSQKIITSKNSQDKASLLAIIKNGSMLTWQHVNMRGEYDFTKAANNTYFDIAKIRALKVKNISI